MNRDIKFRAWDEVSKQWIFFDLTDAISGRLEREGFDVLRLINKSQYTTLRDKNGVEIYEGDILTELGHVKSVQWSEEGAGWVFNVERETGQNYSASIVVIGNIYENPELLEQSK